MNTSSTEMKDALTEVRKAYRLLHDYQKAALDTVRYIASQIGFEYGEGVSNFTDDAPKRGRGALLKSPWSWLNLVFYDFTFKKGDENNAPGFAIFLISDTGYFISDHEDVTKEAISKFASVENSQTVLGFLLFEKWKREFNTVFTQDREAMRRFISNDGELPPLLNENRVIGRCFDFLRVADRASTDAVIGQFVKWGQGNGFAIELIKKPE